MSARIVTPAEAREMLDAANEFTLMDPGSYCNGSHVECSLASECHGEHPTGRMTALHIDAGEESEVLYFAEPGDAALAAAAPDLAATVASEPERVEAAVNAERDAIVANLREWARQSAHRTGNYADALNAAADEIAAGRTP